MRADINLFFRLPGCATFLYRAALDVRLWAQSSQCLDSSGGDTSMSAEHENANRTGKALFPQGNLGRLILSFPIPRILVSGTFCFDPDRRGSLIGNVVRNPKRAMELARKQRLRDLVAPLILKSSGSSMHPLWKTFRKVSRSRCPAHGPFWNGDHWPDPQAQTVS